MTIGVDLRVLQIGHQFRGVGEVAKRTLNRIFDLAVDQKEVDFVFYHYEGEDAKKLLDIPAKLRFREINLGLAPVDNPSRTKAQKLSALWHTLYGKPIEHADECDVFLQFDYALGVPTDTKTLLVKHDIIPYVFWDKYFTSPKTHIKNKALRTTLRTVLHNYKFMRTLRRSLKNATRIITVSQHTKDDLAKHLNVPLTKMVAIPLGASVKTTKTGTHQLAGFPDKPFIFFLGGIDKRRRMVDDLVAVFNNLKAKGHDVQLVLVGENFPSIDGIPDEVVRKAVQQSSYKSDILTLGYIDDITKQRLFQKAIAFVFPTVYEGFGIPVLESMLLECPVVVYRNSSIPEVGGEHALYADNWQDIERSIEELIVLKEDERKEIVARAKAHAQQFTWEKTGGRLYEEIVKLARQS